MGRGETEMKSVRRKITSSFYYPGPSFSLHKTDKQTNKNSIFNVKEVPSFSTPLCHPFNPLRNITTETIFTVYSEARIFKLSNLLVLKRVSTTGIIWMFLYRSTLSVPK